MAPSTRSRGAPAPSRIYNSTPSLQQAQFPPRKRTVRTYGRQNQKTKALRQQTLTQIDFVSSFEEDAEDDLLSDATEEGNDEGNAVEDKENGMPSELPVPGEKESDGDETESGEEEEEREEEPVHSGRKRRGALKEKSDDNQTTKRRRTFGGNVGMKQSKNSRRKTLGDPPSSSYHTQTLTQFYPKGQLIKDSEDEDGADMEDDGKENVDNDGFDDWLREPNSPSPQPRQAPAESLPGLDDIFETASQRIASQEGSIIPQTPAKRNRRAVIPSSSQLSTPLSSHLLSRYGPLRGIYESPSVRGTQADSKPHQLDELPGTVTSPTPTRRKLIIEDSYATGSWGSENQTQSKRSPLKDVTRDTGGAPSLAPSRETSSSPDEELMNTPTRVRPRRDAGLESGDRLRSSQARSRLSTPSPSKRKKVSPMKPTMGLREIPDSDEESESWGEEEIDQENQAPINEPEMEPASGKSQRGGSGTGTQRTRPEGLGLSNAPPPEKERTSFKDKGIEVVEDSTEGEDSDDDDQFAAGPDTLFVLDELGTSYRSTTDEALTQSRRREPSSTPRTTQPVPTPQEPLSSKPLREPIHYPAPTHTQTQPLESQRVPLAVIQGLGEPAYATDILLPVSPTVVSRLASGHLVHINLPFKIYPQVTRFWLYDGSLLQYLACPQPGVQQGPSEWRHEIDQVYELNNPRDEEDMREEEWYPDTIGRYKYLPPAIVSQLLSNLRHKLFSADAGQGAPAEAVELPSDPPSDEQPIPLPNYTNQLAPSSSMGISISQQVEAQLRSESDRLTENPGSEDTILVPSTPMSNRKTPTAHNRQSIVRPSQATTASVASTPDKYHRHHQSQQQPKKQQHHRTPSLRSTHHQHHSSSSHLTFQDYGSSSPPLVLPQSNNGHSTSQLLSKSQMLPDSLLRDETQMPPEIWSSGEED
ncbi:unnamed protein product [Clonostachys solani]|uniref:Uncharacterized protein n=1 Tax=Clonostachys solani TaxID=160281 RepID=A0A9N9Z377_9HYPO|nr:unnamed protein product [Clonostachys solani]